MTTRRSLLTYCAAATTTAVAGCLGGADTDADADGPTPTDTPTSDRPVDPTTDAPGTATPTAGLPGATDATVEGAGGTRPRGTGGPGVALAGTDDRDGPLEHAVTVVTEAATDETPPRLRVTATNASDRPVEVGDARAVVFAYRGDTDGHLLLLPDDGEYPAEAGCWRLADPVATTDEFRLLSLAPGETVGRTLGCYGAPGEDACLPVGEFRFETTFRTRATSAGSAGREDDTPVDGETDTGRAWGFSLLFE
jgi:hypothetical protein